MRKAFRLFRLMGLAALTGCASIIHGTQVSIPVTSTPPGQRVMLDGNEVGETPMYVVLERKSSHTIAIGNDSAAEKVSITRRPSGWLLGNLLIFYGLPALYDLGSGGAYNFNVDHVHATLRGNHTPTVASWIAPKTRVRLAFDSMPEEVIAEWARGDSLAWRWPTGYVYTAADTSDIHISRLSQIRAQVRIGQDRANGGRSGVRVMGGLSTIPMLAGLASSDAAVGAAAGLVAGVYLIPITLPIGYAIGASGGRERWSPLAAYKHGIDLAEGDLVRVGDDRFYKPLTGRVRDMRGDTLLLAVNDRVVPVMRVEGGGTQLQRAQGSHWSKGFLRGAVLGASAAFVGQSLCKCKQRQQDLVIVPLSGAFLGAWISPIFAPRKWVNVTGW